MFYGKTIKETINLLFEVARPLWKVLCKKIDNFYAFLSGKNS